MKTRYKISIIVATSAIVYLIFHGGITNPCMAMYNDGPNCFMFWFQDTSIHISNHNWDSSDGIGSWSGTGEIYQSTVYDDLKNNSGFIFWHMILPTFVILLIYQRDRNRK